MDGWNDKIIGWLFTVLGGLFLLLTALVGLLYKDNVQKHRDARVERDLLRDRMTDLEIERVGKTTVVQIQSDWRDSFDDLRKELREEHRDRDASNTRRHEENTRRLERIENMLIAYGERR